LSYTEDLDDVDTEDLDWEREFAYEELSKPELDKFLKTLQLYYKRQLKTDEQLRVFEDNLETYIDCLKEILKSKKVGYYDKNDIETIRQVYDMLEFYRDPSDSYHEQLESALELTKQYLEKTAYGGDLGRISRQQLSLDDKSGMYQRAKQNVIAEMTNKLVEKEYAEMKEQAKGDILLEGISGEPVRHDFRSLDEKLLDAVEYSYKSAKERIRLDKLRQGESTDPNYGKLDTSQQIKLETLALEQEERRKKEIENWLQNYKERKKREQELFEAYKRQNEL